MSKKCNKCETHEIETKHIPFVSAECEATRQHKIICRLIWVIVLMFVLFAGYVIYNSQYEIVRETTTETYEVDLEQDTEYGNNNCIVNGGEICNGTSESEN